MTITITGINGTSSFSPNPANVRVGQQIRWHNADSMAHTATQAGGGFDTGIVGPGGTSGTVTLSSPGTISYFCGIHPLMTGTLQVSP